MSHKATAPSCSSEETADGNGPGAGGDGSPQYIKVHELRPEGYDGTCLRPLGLCELGGCCDVCWYRPDHPRFAKK